MILSTIELPLGQQHEMPSLGASPRIAQDLVGRTLNVAGDESVQSLLVGDLAGDSLVEDALLMLLHFQGRHHEQLLDPQRVAVLLAQVRTDRGQYSSGLVISVRPSIELGRLQLLLGLDQLLAVLSE